MNIRIMGASDLVRAWSAALEREYGISAALYPMRGETNGLRAYFSLDDRRATEVIGINRTPQQSQSSTAVAAPARRTARSKRVQV